MIRITTTNKLSTHVAVVADQTLETSVGGLGTKDSPHYVTIRARAGRVFAESPIIAQTPFDGVMVIEAVEAVEGEAN
jgi:hypothetical protein